MFAQLLISSAVAALPLLAKTALAADCARTYTVVEGDICDSISAANNASTYQLAAVNSGTIDSACSNLAIGSSVCLGTVGEDCQTTYVVQEGDTCDQIASAHSINTTILYTNNPNIDDACSNIYIGEVLCVSDSVLVPPIPSSGIPATTIPATAANPTQTANFVSQDDEDNEDIPWCDEL
ncbi:hypothetical protein ACEPAH_7539 [Sanghuangporus vaninii]